MTLMQSNEIYEWLMDNPPTLIISNINVWETIASHYFFMVTLNDPLYELNCLGDILEKAKNYNINIPNDSYTADIVSSSDMVNNDQFLQDTLINFYEKIKNTTN